MWEYAKISCEFPSMHQSETTFKREGFNKCIWAAKATTAFLQR